jgi:hypothetical protein
MKPTVTNCFDCWTEDQRATPATWAVADEFFCDGHFRKAGLDPAGAMTIEAYKAAHGIDQPHPPGDPTKFNGKAFRYCPCGKRIQHGKKSDLCAKCRKAPKTETSEKQEKEPMKNQQAETPRKCSREDCDAVLGPSNTTGRCAKHYYVRKGGARKTTSKAPRRDRQQAGGVSGDRAEPRCPRERSYSPYTRSAGRAVHELADRPAGCRSAGSFRPGAVTRVKRPVNNPGGEVCKSAVRRLLIPSDLESLSTLLHRTSPKTSKRDHEEKYRSELIHRFLRSCTEILTAIRLACGWLRPVAMRC